MKRKEDKEVKDKDGFRVTKMTKPTGTKTIKTKTKGSKGNVSNSTEDEVNRCQKLQGEIPPPVFQPKLCCFSSVKKIEIVLPEIAHLATVAFTTDSTKSTRRSKNTVLFRF